VGSTYTGSKGIVAVYAGIDFDKEQQTREEILRQLDAMCRGEITETEMTAARESIRSGLYSVTDTPGGIEGYHMSAAMLGYNADRDARLAALEAVTVEQVARAAQQLRLHTTYFLKGEN
jgi:predicted Zn-dependent peptidase